MLNCGKNRTSFDSALFLNMNAGCMGWKFNYEVHNNMKGAELRRKGNFSLTSTKVFLTLIVIYLGGIQI